jgi:16S rRNA (uracil1498-N3)-methyltransferase
MQLFFAPEIENNPVLDEEESRHCVKVLRFSEGQELMVTNGKGFFFRSRLTGSSVKGCKLEILEKIKVSEKEHPLHLAVAPTKNLDRMEWMVEKAVEIGVGEISFFLSEHSERRVLKTDRLEKKAMNAMKQSLQGRLPNLNPLISIEELVAKSRQQIKLVCYQDPQSQPFQKLIKQNEKCLVLIGPEGDFSRKELDFLKSSGFTIAHLGLSRLRTETAALVACSIFNLAE